MNLKVTVNDVTDKELAAFRASDGEEIAERFVNHLRQRVELAVENMERKAIDDAFEDTDMRGRLLGVISNARDK